MKKHLQDFAVDLGWFIVYTAAAGVVFAFGIVPLTNAVAPGFKPWLKTIFPGLVS